MILRQLFDSDSSTYTYLIGDPSTAEAVLIDPVREQVPAYIRLLSELDLKLIWAIDTHVHADHVTGLGALRDALDCRTAMGRQAKAPCVSHRISDGEEIRFGAGTLTAMYTPGHTDDSYCFALVDRGTTYLFTGDTLLIRGTGRTDFQNGDARTQYHSLFDRLLDFEDDTVVLPGHDYKGWTRSSIGEERRHNPRLQVTSVDEYVTLMDNLHLPHPKMMDVAVPANQQCGDTPP